MRSRRARSTRARRVAAGCVGLLWVSSSCQRDRAGDATGAAPPHGVAAMSPGGGAAGAAGDGGAGAPTSVDEIPATRTVVAPGLTSPVDVVRDEWGVPHIYGESLPDVAFAQGYVTATDRFVAMDVARHRADGTLAQLVGRLDPSALASDLRTRAFGLRAAAAAAYDDLRSSNDATDAVIVAALEKYADGVNAYLVELRAGDYLLPPALGVAYGPASVQPWKAVDSLLIGQYEAFSLSFDADGDLARSGLDAGAAVLRDSADPSLNARAFVGDDLQSLVPIDPTFTLPLGTDDLARRLPLPTGGVPGVPMATIEAAREGLTGLGLDRRHAASRGGNAFAVAASHAAAGHTLLAHDTHVATSSPLSLYLVHLVARSAQPTVDVIGAQVPGVPAVALGANRHLAWGSTAAGVDATDVYAESIVACRGGGLCTTFHGQSVPLVVRSETFYVGALGEVDRSVEATYYNVPTHGPLVPRFAGDGSLAPPLAGTTALSVRYTGAAPKPLLRAEVALDVTTSAEQARQQLALDVHDGAQNWVVGDDEGHITWSQPAAVPVRPATTLPWKVLAGDGSAEWSGVADPALLPSTVDPPSGFLVAADADPTGATLSGDPRAGRATDGSPLYLGADYDPGTRAGRITDGLRRATASPARASFDDVAAVQSDAVTEWGQIFSPTLVDAARALAGEAATPGSFPEVSGLVSGAGATVRATFAKARDALTTWSFDTPSGEAGEGPTGASANDARATAIYDVWFDAFAVGALGDEVAALGLTPGDTPVRRLLARAVTDPSSLASGISPLTGDALLFDDLTTPVVESKRQIAAKALVVALSYLAKNFGHDPGGWKWGALHGFEEPFVIAPLTALALATEGGSSRPGVARRGDVGTVDAGDHATGTGNTSSNFSPAFRFVCELDPAKGPHLRVALAGGEVFDPASPHSHDLIALWRRNELVDLPFDEPDVAASAAREVVAHGLGRVRFTP